MNKTDFLHEIKQIETIERSLRYNRERLKDIEDNLIVKINNLMDIAHKYIPEKEDL